MDRAVCRRAAAALGGGSFFVLGTELLLRSGYEPPSGPGTWGLALAASLSGLAWALYLLSLRSGEKPAAPAGMPEKTAAAGTLDRTLPLIFHEIKNYAYTMKGNASLLRNQIPGGDAHVSLERLERATERIEKLSREVMDLSLLGKPDQTVIHDLGAIIRASAEDYFQGLGLAFQFRSDRPGFPIRGEARKIEQVFLNLFKNAMEAGAKRIEVSLLAQPGKVGVLIEDDGKGCPPEQVEKMFDAYQSFRRGQGGSGLGLFLVRAIVEGHGGSISGFSKNQKTSGVNGMVFVLQFPLAGEG